MFLVSIFGADCDLVQSLATGLGMDVVQPSIMELLKVNCCSGGTGVTCINSTVTRISWTNLGLNQTINATAVPKSIYYLNLGSNLITGGIPDLPVSLHDLYIDHNAMNGSLPDLIRYTTMEKLSIVSNYFSGPFPQTNAALQYLYADNNQLDGPLRSNHISWLHLSNNMFTGTLNVLTTKRRVTLNVGGNLLTGNFPSNLVIDRRLYLGSTLSNTNRITGTLNIAKPWELSIVNNLITLLNVGSVSSLTYCDISHNPAMYNKTLLDSKCTGNYVGSNYTELLNNYSPVTYVQQYDYETLDYNAEYTSDYTQAYSTETTLLEIHQEILFTSQLSNILKTRIVKRLTTITTNPITSDSTDLNTADTTLKMTQNLYTTSTSTQIIKFSIDNSLKLRITYPTIFSIIKLITDLIGLITLAYLLIKRYKLKHLSSIGQKNRHTDSS